ncbi:MAG: hypothetical protein L3J82_09340 [Planctomycetes bacterium]|nr:hypothetical protein [Planctomycetota bacterium]
MDDQTFRRLSLDGIRRKLEPNLQEQWESHQAQSTVADEFVQDLLAKHRDISSRFVESKRLAVAGRQHDVDPAGDLAPPNLQRSDMIRRAIFFAVAGAILGGVITAANLQGRAAQANAALDSVASGNEAVEDPPTNTVVPDNSTDAEPTNNTSPPENRPAVNEGNTSDNGNESNKEPDTQPEVMPAPPLEVDVVFVAELKSGKASYRPVGDGQEFMEMRTSGALFVGERMEVTEGSVQYTSDGLSIVGSSKLGMSIVGQSESSLSLEMFTGRAVVRSSRAVEIEIYENRLTFKNAAFVLEVNSTGSQLFLFEGFIDIRRNDNFKKVIAPRHVNVGRGLLDSAISDYDYNRYEPELLGPHKTLLKWTFEKGRGICTLGDLVDGGTRGSKKAMRSKGVASDIGTDVKGALFTSAPDAVLRFQVLTVSPRVRISARLLMTGGWRRVSLSADVPPGEGWKTITLPLTDFAFNGNRSGTGFKPYASYSRLKFTAISESGSIFNAQSMLIDNVHIYAPK